MALRLAVLLALNQLMALVNGETAILNLGGVFSFINKKDTHDVAGSQQFAAFRMAINEINDKNDGIFDDLLPDVQVKLAVRDGKDDFAQSVLHALDFTKKIMRPVGTHVVFSIADDNVTKGLASVLSGADVTQFTTTSTAELSKADRYPTMLRLIPSDAYQGTTFAKIMKSSHWNVNRVIAFSSSDTFGTDALLEFTSVAKANNVRLVSHYLIADYQEDFTEIIKDALTYQCKAFVFLTSRATDVSHLLVQGADAGLFTGLTSMFFNQLLHSKELHAAVVTKHGPTIMRGAVMLNPLTHLWMQEKAGQEFLKRFLAQKDTVTTGEDGKDVCHDDVDDTGKPMYTTETSEGATICAGLRFSELSSDGRDVNHLIAYAYDAVMVYLHAIDFLLKNKLIVLGQIRRQVISGKLVKKTMAESINFRGVTENISFSGGRAGSKVYGYGDRDKGVGYKILNWQVENTSVENTSVRGKWSGGFKHVGFWSTDHGLQLCDPNTPAWYTPASKTAALLSGCHLPIHYASKDGFSMPPPDYGQSPVWPYAVAAAVVLATSLYYFFTRQGSNLLDTKSSRSSSTNSSSRRLLRSTTVGSTSSGGSHTVMINGSPQFLPVIDWNELVIDDHNPLLGKGSFGFVFKGMWLDPQDNVHHEVAVKVMSRQVCTVKDFKYEDQLRMAREEAALTIFACTHGRRIENSITCVYGFCEGALPDHLTEQFGALPGEEAFGIVMRLEKGGSLSDNMYKLADFYSMTDKVRLLLGIAQGIVKLHAINVIHGDLKPANILLSEHNPPETRISDFGLSAMKDKESLGANSLYMTHHTKGTVKYCAPEMLNDEGDGVARASRRTDIYAFAIMAWEILTNKRPFENIKTERALEKAVLNGDRPPMDVLPHDTPPAVKEMIRLCWDNDRATRLSASECYAILSTCYSQLSTGEYDIFFSHRWANKPFLSHLHHLLCEHGYRVWYDANEMGFDLVTSMTQGIEKSIVVLCCVDSEYAKSTNCMLELRHATKVINERSARTRALVGVTTERDIRKWSGSDEVRDLLDINNKMYVDLSDLAQLTDPDKTGPDGEPVNAWESQDGASPQMMHDLRESTKPLLKLLKNVGCLPSVKLLTSTFKLNRHANKLVTQRYNPDGSTIVTNTTPSSGGGTSDHMSGSGTPGSSKNSSHYSNNGSRSKLLGHDSRSKFLGNDSLMSSIGQSTYTTATKATATTAASTATATE